MCPPPVSQLARVTALCQLPGVCLHWSLRPLFWNLLKQSWPSLLYQALVGTYEEAWLLLAPPAYPHPLPGQLLDRCTVCAGVLSL